MLLFRAQSIKAYCCVFKTGSKFVPSICNSNEIGECISNDSKNRHQADLLVSWCNLTAIQNGQYNFERGVMKGGGAEGGRLTIIVGVVVTNGAKNSFLPKELIRLQGKQRITNLSWRFILKATGEEKKSE